MERWELIGGILKRIRGFNVKDWKDRLMAQKILFMFQCCLMENLGYSFNWYVRGPYSSPLAKDFYKLETTDKVTAIMFKDEKKEEDFCKFLSLIDPYKDNSDVIELTASLFFFSSVGKTTDPDLMNKLKSRKPQFEQQQYENALELYRNILALKNQR